MNALEQDKDFWENKITIYSHGLLVFNRKGKIEEAKKRISAIERLIQKDRELLVKNSNSIINKIKNAAYKITGAETKEDQGNIGLDVGVIKSINKKIKKNGKNPDNTNDINNNTNNTRSTNNNTESKKELEKTEKTSLEEEKKTEERDETVLTSNDKLKRASSNNPYVEHEIQNEKEIISSINAIKGKDKRSVNFKKHKAIQLVSSIYNKREKETIKVSNIMMDQNKKIISLLTKIEEDSIIEQNVAITQKTPIKVI